MFDFKKAFKSEYSTKDDFQIIRIPKINYLAVFGKGNPNDLNGEYQESIELLYPIAYTLKMSYRSNYEIEGFYEYVVPPLEGFWWIEGLKGMDNNRKDELQFISLIRLPDFISKLDFNWAIKVSTEKKNIDFSKVQFFSYEEGLCIQALHIGSYDSEQNTVDKMHEYLKVNNYELDFATRYHHEIYISDPRRTNLDKLKTIIRHPIKEIDIKDK